jgi:hypothetical protein
MAGERLPRMKPRQGSLAATAIPPHFVAHIPLPSLTMFAGVERTLPPPLSHPLAGLPYATPASPREAIVKP